MPRLLRRNATRGINSIVHTFIYLGFPCGTPGITVTSAQRPSPPQVIAAFSVAPRSGLFGTHKLVAIQGDAPDSKVRRPATGVWFVSLMASAKRFPLSDHGRLLHDKLTQRLSAHCIVRAEFRWSSNLSAGIKGHRIPMCGCTLDHAALEPCVTGQKRSVGTGDQMTCQVAGLTRSGPSIDLFRYH